MKKTIVILLTLILTLCLGINAAADSTDLDAPNPETVLTEESVEEESAAPTVEETEESILPTADGQAQTQKNPFTALYELASAHTSEIFSALAAVLSCVIAFAYRRGLLPLVKQGIGTLASTVGGIDKATEAAREQMLAEAQTNRSLTEQMEKSIAQLSQKMSEILARFDALENDKTVDELLLSTLRTEVELLGEIFLSSSLPEYRKEIVGGTIARLKEQLTTREGA